MAIPTGDYKARSNDPRINYNLLPGEELMTCPYIFSHAVRQTKFASHVLNCYRLHCKEQASKGQQPLFEICQFDRSHHVRKELLAHHEHTCDARKNDDDWGESVTKQETSEGAPTSKALDLDQRQDEEESWEETCHGRFDPERRVRELRKAGTEVVRGPPTGLSKSEKKEFYEKEKKLMAGYAHLHFLQSVQQNNSTKAHSSASSTYSAGDDGILLPIKEEDAQKSAMKKH